MVKFLVATFHLLMAIYAAHVNPAATVNDGSASKKIGLLQNLQLAHRYSNNYVVPEARLLWETILLADIISDGHFSKFFSVRPREKLEVIMFELHYYEESPKCLVSALMDFFKEPDEEQALAKAIVFVLDYGPIVPYLVTLKPLTFYHDDHLLTAINWIRSTDGAIFAKLETMFKFKSYLTVDDVKRFSGVEEEPWCYYETLMLLHDKAGSLEEAMRRTVQMVHNFRLKIKHY